MSPSRHYKEHSEKNVKTENPAENHPASKFFEQRKSESHKVVKLQHKINSSQNVLANLPEVKITQDEINAKCRDLHSQIIKVQSG